MRVLMIVSNDVVHDARVLKEARALSDAGHDLEFIGWDRGGRGPPEARVDGFQVRYVSTRGLMRYAGTDLLRNPLWWRRAASLGRRGGVDVVHCHDLDTLPAGVSLKRRLGCRLVYDAHEVFSYMIEADVPALVARFASRMEARLAPSADAVIAVNEMVGRHIAGMITRPPILVRNCVDPPLGDFHPLPARPFTVLYIGTLHKSRFILPAIDVVADLPDVRLVLGGGKALQGAVQTLAARHPNTQYVGEVPNERVLPMTLEAHAVLSMFDPAYRINQVGMPNKIYEAMATGRPSIVTQGLAMSEVVVREGCGLAVPYSKEGFRQAVEQLRDDPVLVERLGRNGLAAAQRDYNWTAESRRLVSLYESLAR